MGKNIFYCTTNHRRRKNIFHPMGKKRVKKNKIQKQAISHNFILITYYIGVFYEESKFF